VTTPDPAPAPPGVRAVGREALSDVLDAVVALHLASWRDAYRGLLPDAYLDGALAGDLWDKWRRKATAADPARDLLVVAEDARGLTGFAFACFAPDRPDSAFLDNLHVKPGARGGGIGTALMRAVAPRLASLGYRGLHLKVFASNAAAIRFYERLGGKIEVRAVEDLMGYPADTYRMAWSDLSAL
jgi:ribosomal protein S18 acetylase RimI-like enzyme